MDVDIKNLIILLYGVTVIGGLEIVAIMNGFNGQLLRIVLILITFLIGLSLNPEKMIEFIKTVLPFLRGGTDVPDG